MDPSWLRWARGLQAIAQNGLTYATDVYDQERYQAIREVAAEMMAARAGTDRESVLDLFAKETGYATPKVDVRGAVFRDEGILLVREASDGRWSLPGGWADVNDSPSENIVREIAEESGFETRVRKLAAVLDRGSAVRERIGMLLMERRSYAEAAEIFEAAVKGHPSAANLAALAQAYSLSDQPEKALHLWRQAASASPSNAELRLRYANSLLHARQFEDAARNYFVAVEQDGTLPEAWSGLAFSLYKVDNFGGALKALQQSSQIAPPKPAQVYLRAIIEDKQQMYKEAQASYQNFLAMNAGMSDEEWKSKERLKVIEKVLRKR